MAGTQVYRLKDRDTLGMYGALKALGNRKMSTALADVRVGKLLSEIAPKGEHIEKAYKRCVTDVTEGIDLEKLNPVQQQELLAKIAAAQNVLGEQETDITLSNIRLKQDDLPKVQPGDDGWKNAANLGAIISDLGFLFEFPEDVTPNM